MKKIIKQFLVAIMIMFPITFISCYGEIDEPSTAKNNISFGEYLYDMSIIKGKGTILLQSNEFETTQNNGINIDISEKESTSKLINIEDKNGEKINVTECNKDLFSKKNIYGSTINCIINNITNEIYVPELLILDYNKQTINKGSVINWNVDKKNEKGVIIWLSYSPLDQRDFNLLAKHRKIITYGLVTDDTGTYTFKEEDLERFPKKSTLCLNIARTNYIVNEKELPSFIAYTTVSKNVGYLE
jgi:hypothetical protein